MRPRRALESHNRESNNIVETLSKLIFPPLSVSPIGSGNQTGIDPGLGKPAGRRKTEQKPEEKTNPNPTSSLWLHRRPPLTREAKADSDQNRFIATG